MSVCGKDVFSMLRLMFPFMVFSAKIKGPSTWLYGSPCHIHFSSIVVINLEALFHMFVKIVLNSSHCTHCIQVRGCTTME